MNLASRSGKVRILLGVVALTATPLAVSHLASPSSPPEPHTCVRVVPVVLVQPMVIEMARPRMMPSGAPACGNVSSRSPRDGACDRSEP